VVYDRAGSAAGTIGPADFDWPAILAEAAIAHTDGIFPGLGPSCRQAAATFLQTARDEGCRTSFDCNYREHLWTPAQARDCWSELLPLVDVVVTNRDVSEQVFGLAGTDAELARQYAERFGCRVVCLTRRESLGLARGAFSSLAHAHGRTFEGRRQEFEIVDRYGAGDAWLAGFLHAQLDDQADIAAGLRFADALCALAHTVEGDVVHVSPAEVLAIVQGGPDLRLKR
jgi:2-dehydro-3-deoxygluconokinase